MKAQEFYEKYEGKYFTYDGEKVMKREILFRGKSIEPSTDGKWTIGSLVVHGNCSYILPEIPFTPFGIVKYRVDPETVGQFTGMKDKNGTKIFEGDILNEPFQGGEKLYYVFLDEDYFSFRVKSGRYDYYLDEMQKYHCEVVGNIYDNK